MDIFVEFCELTQSWQTNTEQQQEEILRILRSSLPGRSKAGSKVSGLFVAMIILTLCNVSKPSIWFSSWQDTYAAHWSTIITAYSSLSTWVWPCSDIMLNFFFPMVAHRLLQDLSLTSTLTSIRVLWISLSAEVPSEKRRPPTENNTQNMEWRQRQVLTPLSSSNLVLLTVL